MRSRPRAAPTSGRPLSRSASHSWRSTPRPMASGGCQQAGEPRGALAFGVGTLQRSAQALPQHPEPNPPVQTADVDLFESAQEKLADGRNGTRSKKSRSQHDLLALANLPAPMKPESVSWNWRRPCAAPRPGVGGTGRVTAGDGDQASGAGCGCEQDEPGGRLGCGPAGQLCQSGLARRRCRAVCAGLCRQTGRC
jgi:hypothetical protein